MGQLCASSSANWSWCASSPKDPVIATSPAYHDHPPQRLLQNFPDTTNGPVSPGEQRASGPAPQPTFDQRNRRVSWGCGEPTFAASLPDGVVAPVLGAARASAHADNPGRSVPSRKWEMGGKHR